MRCSAFSAPRLVWLGSVLLLPLASLHAQQRPAKTPAKAATGTKPDAPLVVEPVYESHQVQIQPEYPEGKFALLQYLSKQIRLPAEVRAGRLRGAVQVRFVVWPDGRLMDAYVATGLSAATNAEALRLVQAMPRWRPGRLSEQAVATRTQLDVFFEAAPATSEDKVYTYVEEMPEYPGGKSALYDYFRVNLRYPAKAAAEQIEGKVFVSFVVRPTGRVSEVKIVKGLGGGCDEEAQRLVKNMPMWAPGKQNSRLVAVSYTLPITFQLTKAPSVPASPNEVPVSAPKPAEPEKVYTYVEQMPGLGSPAGSLASVNSALQAALVLPAEVREGRVEGLSYVSFVVRPDGTTSDAKVLRPLCPACDAAALAAVGSLPRLVPGQQNGVPVAVQLSAALRMYGPSHVFEPGQVAKAAMYPGGPDALQQYVREKLREPKVVKQEGLKGLVEVSFVVQADGSIGAAEVARSMCRSCDEEALRLVRAMPRWMPARTEAGQAVAVRQRLVVQLPAPDMAPRGSRGSIRQLPPPGQSPQTALLTDIR